MLFTTVALLALATASIASPHNKRQHSHWHAHGHGHGTGTGTGGWGTPTGAGLHQVNASDYAAQAAASGTGWGTGYGTGSSSVTVDVVTMTVSPLPVSSDAGAASTGVASNTNHENMSAPSQASSATGAAVYWIPASSGPPVDAGASLTSTACISTSTTTVTSIDMYTVTVQPVQNTPVSSAAAVSSVASSAAAYPPAASPTPAQPSIPSSSSVSPSSTTATVAAGAFFQKPPPSVASPPPAASTPPAYQPTTMVTSAASAATLAAAASSAAPSPSSAPSSSSTGGKKGLSYASASLTQAFAGKGMSWAYNWAPAPGGTLLAGVEFVPMNWGPKDFSSWSSVASADHYLSFNEPDIGSQAAMTPSDAAAAHIKYMNPLAAKAKIGSPAVTNGATTSPPMGLNWLTQFFTACAGQCKIDFVAYHWYNTAASIADFKQHTQDIINLAQQNGVSKVWCTEFGTVGSSDADTATFLTQALAYLESTEAVERYSYFMVGTGAGQLLSSSTALSTIGQAYTS